jgi:PAS domain S-box-containing protein
MGVNPPSTVPGASATAPRAARLCLCLGGYAIGAGALTLIGWAFDLPRLTALDGSIAMQPNTAVALLCAGSALALCAFGQRALPALLGLFAGLIGAVTLFEHVSGRDLGIDRLIDFGRSWGLEATTSPGRMGLPASTSLTVVGLGIVLASAPRNLRLRALVPWLGLAISGVGLLAVIGYLFGADRLYTIPRLTGIAFPTATAIVALGLGLGASLPDLQPFRTLLADSGAGLAARRVLPLIVVLPILLGWMSLNGTAAQLYDPPMATSLLVLFVIVLMCAVLGWDLRALTAREHALADAQESRIRADLVMDAGRDQFVLLDRDWRFQYTNDRIVDLTGITREQMLGQTLWDVFPDVVGTPLDAAARRAMERREAELLEYHHLPWRRWFDTRIYPMGDGGLALFLLDISDRRRAQDALREREGELRLLADLAPVGLARCDRELRYRFVNASYAHVFGFEPAEIVGKRMPEVIEAETYARIAPQIDAVLGGQHVEYEIELAVQPTLGLRVFQVAYEVERDAYGAAVGFVAALVDVTERRRAEQALRDADRRKDEFLATLAHELRNPLAPIRNSLEVMKRASADGAAVERARGMAERQVSQMVRLVEDLLDVSRITRNRLELRRERVDVASALHHAVEACRPLAERAGVEIAVELPPEPIALHADSVRLAQVFGNLLTNACKYTHRGDRIRVRAERDSSHVSIAVRDNGKGIPPERLAHAFEMFAQIDRTQQDGLGIGLALVKRLVELHDGSVTAYSEGPGRGSEFRVRLPLALGEPPAAVPLPASAPDGLAAPPGPRRRVLVVDDHRDGALSLAMLLRLAGNEVAVAHDGLDALERAAEFGPELVLLDIGMPKLDGYEVCRALRARPGGSALRIVAMTGWGQEEDRRRSREAGFDAHLVKPVDPAALAIVLAEPLQV